MVHYTAWRVSKNAFAYPVYFASGRSVESSAIKKALDAIYSTFLPKGGHPFVYISLDIEPHRVDVNIHPTKREVNFLHEDEIIEKLCAAAQGKLAAVDTSRSYTLTQTLLPGAPTLTDPPTASSSKSTDRSGKNLAPNPASTHAILSKPFQVPKKTYENNTVRVDARDRKITSMLPRLPQQAQSEEGSTAIDNTVSLHQEEYETDEQRQWQPVPYASIKTLRKHTKESVHQGLYELFLNHIFVGLVDDHRRLAAVQHGVKLYLVDYGQVACELFYQIMLADFRNVGRIRLNPPLPLRELLQIAVDEEKRREEQLRAAQNPTEEEDVAMTDADQENGAEPEKPFDWDYAVNTIVALLVKHREMLSDYFSFDITPSGELASLPLLLKNYMPCLGKLPAFLLRLGPNVTWDVEIECFNQFIRELALFYVPEQLPPQPAVVDGDGKETEESREMRERRKEMARVVEEVLFPALRKRMVPTGGLLRAVTEIANLKGLYRIFERSC